MQVFRFGVDHIGHGMSEGVEAPITDFAKGVTAVARAAQAENVTVAGFVGHSIGCAGTCAMTCPIWPMCAWCKSRRLHR